MSFLEAHVGDRVVMTRTVEGVITKIDGGSIEIDKWWYSAAPDEELVIEVIQRSTYCTHCGRP